MSSWPSCVSELILPLWTQRVRSTSFSIVLFTHGLKRWNLLWRESCWRHVLTPMFLAVSTLSWSQPGWKATSHYRSTLWTVFLHVGEASSHWRISPWASLAWLLATAVWPHIPQGEYCVRILMKTSEFMTDASRCSTVLNLCFDAAFVSEEHDIWTEFHISISDFFWLDCLGISALLYEACNKMKNSHKKKQMFWWDLFFCFSTHLTWSQYLLAQVLSVVFRAFGRQFAGATQLLPVGLKEDQRKDATKAFAEALKVMYTQNGETPKLPQGTFKWKEFRTPTKNLLMAISNSIMQAMPAGFNMSKCIPSRPLVPRGNQGERILLEPAEKRSLGLDEEEWPDDMNLHFVWNFDAQSGYPDYIDDSKSHFKLAFAADEGTEACGLPFSKFHLSASGSSSTVFLQ